MRRKRTTLRRRASEKAPTPASHLSSKPRSVEAMAEFDRGEYIELTREQLDHAARTGEWPWAEDESRG